MNTRISRAALAVLLAVGVNGGALASGDCGMNSNKPCPNPPKSSAKEPAYKSLNSNKPATTQAQQATDTPAQVQADAPQNTPARATLSGVNPNDLKLKPRSPPTSSKEPANSD